MSSHNPPPIGGTMPWAWTDDLARQLMEHEGGRSEDLAEWLSRPTAVRIPDDADILDVAKSLVVVETDP